jgi:hypothetical protein
MSRRLPDAADRLTFTARSAYQFWKGAGVNVYLGDPGYRRTATRTQASADISVWAQQMVDMNLSVARICGGPLNDSIRGNRNVAEALAEHRILAGLGFDLIYTVWHKNDYNAFLGGQFPVPVAIELLNEWYGFIQATAYDGLPSSNGTWSGSSVSYAVGDRMTCNGIYFVCRQAHTSTATNGPGGAGGAAAAANESYNDRWVPLWMVETRTLERDIATIRSTLAPRWNDVVLLGPGKYTDAGEINHGLAVGPINAVANWHEYKFPAGALDLPGGYFDAIAERVPTVVSSPMAGSAFLEFGAWRSGPNNIAADIQAIPLVSFQVDPESAAKLELRAFMYGHWRVGYRWMCRYQLIDTRTDAAGQSFSGLIDWNGQVKPQGIQLGRLLGLFRQHATVPSIGNQAPLDITRTGASTLRTTVHNADHGKRIVGYWLGVDVTTTPNTGGDAGSGVVGTWTAGTPVTTSSGVTLAFGQAFSRVELYQPEIGDRPTATFVNVAAGQALSLTATERVRVLVCYP